MAGGGLSLSPVQSKPFVPFPVSVYMISQCVSLSPHCFSLQVTSGNFRSERMENLTRLGLKVTSTLRHTLCCTYSKIIKAKLNRITPTRYTDKMVQDKPHVIG